MKSQYLKAYLPLDTLFWKLSFYNMLFLKKYMNLQNASKNAKYALFWKKITKKELEFFLGLYQVLLSYRIKNFNEKNINLNLVQTLNFPKNVNFVIFHYKWFGTMNIKNKCHSCSYSHNLKKHQRSQIWLLWKILLSTVRAELGSTGVLLLS